MLKLNGKPWNAMPIRPSVLLLKQFLDKAPADEIFTQTEAAKHAKLHINTLRGSNVYDDPNLEGYSIKSGVIRFWGNPRAIKEYQRQVNA